MGQYDKSDAENKILGIIAGAHFAGIGGEYGDLGFASEFQDGYLYDQYWGGLGTRQLGHFLSAIDLGFRDNPIAVAEIVGHEQSSDALGALPQIGWMLNSLRYSGNDVFSQAVDADAMGRYTARDNLLQSLMFTDRYGPQKDRRGNSMEDLRLSAKGFRLGQTVNNNGISTNTELANCIMDPEIWTQKWSKI